MKDVFIFIEQITGIWCDIQIDGYVAHISSYLSDPHIYTLGLSIFFSIKAQSHRRLTYVNTKSTQCIFINSYV